MKNGEPTLRTPTTGATIPEVQVGKEEAGWWDAHQEVVTALFPKAKKEGKIKRLPVIRGGS